MGGEGEEGKQREGVDCVVGILSYFRHLSSSYSL